MTSRPEPKIDRRVAKLLERHRELLEMHSDIQQQIARVVDQLLEKYPGEYGAVCQVLSGQEARLLHLRCTKKGKGNGIRIGD